MVLELLYENRLEFIRVVKRATQKFSMEHLIAHESEIRGDLYGLMWKKVSEDQCDLLLYVWINQDHRYL